MRITLMSLVTMLVLSAGLWASETAPVAKPATPGSLNRRGQYLKSIPAIANRVPDTVIAKHP